MSDEYEEIELEEGFEEVEETQEEVDGILQDMSIDKYSLDEEAARHMAIVRDVARVHPRCEELEDMIRGSRRRYRANVTSEIRARINSKLKKGEKAPTEKLLEHKVLKDEEYIQWLILQSKAIALKTKGEVLKSALYHRSQMIKHLADLWFGEYYGDPKLAGEGSDKGSIDEDRKSKRLKRKKNQ